MQATEYISTARLDRHVQGKTNFKTHTQKLENSNEINVFKLENIDIIGMKDSAHASHEHVDNLLQECNTDKYIETVMRKN